LATNSSIDSDIAAEFIARILYRINDYIPIVLEYRDPYPLTWLEFISGMQKMAYLTEILKYQLETNQLSQESYFLIHEKGNTMINSNKKHWFETVIQMLSSEIGMKQAELLEQLRLNKTFPDALKYVLLGNADRIFITQ